MHASVTSGTADSADAMGNPAMSGESLIHLASLPYSVVEVSGDDARSFLQGQFSNDLSAIDENTAVLNGYCNPKGRLLALPRVLVGPAGLRIVVHRSVAAALVKRLRMFVLRADVRFELREDVMVGGLMGSEAGLSSILGHAWPDTTFGTRWIDGTTLQVLRWFDGMAGYARVMLIGAAVDQSALVEALPRQTTDEVDAWLQHDIAAGIPEIDASTAEAFVPQMVNLQAIGGLSFRKGCYPGQEIVARMQYLGKLKRRMRRFAVEGLSSPPAPGTAISTVDAGDGTAGAGEVVSAVVHDDGVQMLAVVREGVAVETLRIEGHALVEQPLPYALDEG